MSQQKTEKVEKVYPEKRRGEELGILRAGVRKGGDRVSPSWIFWPSSLRLLIHSRRGTFFFLPPDFFGESTREKKNPRFLHMLLYPTFQDYGSIAIGPELKNLQQYLNYVFMI
jgi:hypothetical protein